MTETDPHHDAEPAGGASPGAPHEPAYEAIPEFRAERMAPPPRPPIMDHDPPPPTPPKGMAPAAMRGGTPLAVTLLLFALLAAGLVWNWSHSGTVSSRLSYRDAGQIQTLSERIDALERQSGQGSDPNSDLSKHLDDISSRLDSVTAQVQKLQDSMGQNAGDRPPADASNGQGQADQDLSAKLDQIQSESKSALEALDQRLGRLEQSGVQPGAPQANNDGPDRAGMEALEERIARLERSGSAYQNANGSLYQNTNGRFEGAGGNNGSLALRLAAAQVALSAGQPIGSLPGAPPALARFAYSAAPTEADLRAGFSSVSAAILAASHPEEAKQSFLDRALARVEQTVTVRRGSHVIVGDPAAGVVARAQDALNNNDLAGAVTALNTLRGSAADAARDWVEQAQALLDARAALADMAAHD
jgi:hypothetical protein